MLREELTLMVNAKTVNIQNTTYTLKGFSDTYNLSYSTVRKYYKKGYRGLNLLSKVRPLGSKQIKINGTTYVNRKQAAEALNVPLSTFYAKYKKTL